MQTHVFSLLVIVPPWFHISNYCSLEAVSTTQMRLLPLRVWKTLCAFCTKSQARVLYYSCRAVMKTHFSGRVPFVERTLLLANTGLSRIRLSQWLIDVGLKRPRALSQDSSTIHSLELSPESG